MANEMKLPYVRFVRRVQSANKAIVQWKTTMAETFEALKIASWKESTALASEVSMPVNAPLTFTPSDAYDTFKMSSTVAGSGKQTCHMGMAAYRFTIPADAITDSTHPTAVTLSLGTDKFNTSGLRVALYLSNTDTPPTDWTICREGTQHIPDETIDTVTLGILASRTLLVSTATNSAGEYTVTFDPVIAANNAYLYVIISNYDYEDYRASREYYIEGSGVLDGANVQVGFEASVTADAPVVIWDGRYKAGGKYPSYSGTPVYQQNNTKFLVTRASMNGEEWILSTFPQNVFGGSFTATFSQFDGDANTTIGVESGGKVSGCALVRAIKVINGVPFTKFQFGESIVADLRLKSLNLLVNVWYGKPAEAAPTVYAAYGKPTAETMELESFYFSSAVDGAKLTYYPVNSWVESAAMTLFNAGQFLLKSGSLITSADKFDINITGNGIYYMIIAVAPVTISPASAGASTNVVFKPGEFLYLS
jgi:hypothetical protein